MAATEIIILAVIAIVLWKFSAKIYKFICFCNAVNKLPGPAPYPWPFLAYVGARVKIEDRILWIHNLHLTFKEGIMKLAIFDEAFILLCKPRHMEAIFPRIDTITKAVFYDTLEPWLGRGLLTSTGRKWFHDRKLLTPAFHFGVVDQFTETMTEKAEVLVECLEKQIKANPGKSIDFYVHAVRCALDIICETSMGTNMDVQRNHSIEYINALQILLDSIAKRIFYPWLKWDWLFYRTKLGKDFKASAELMKNFTMEIIKKRKELRSRRNKDFQSDEEHDEFGKRQKKAFLDLMLDMNENEEVPMTDEEIREQVETFMFAGHDTTASAINWAIFSLGNNPEVQEKLHQELDRVFGDSKEPATTRQIAELSYLERVIKENLRMYPSVPAVARRLTKSIDLDGYVIPKGCNISMHIMTLHLDPETWPDPTKFDPDRFLPENCRGRHPYAYVPFSAGPRNCIGMKFAYAEQKIVLTAILRKWRIQSVRSPEDMKLQANIILCPHQGNPIYFISR